MKRAVIGTMLAALLAVLPIAAAAGDQPMSGRLPWVRVTVGEEILSEGRRIKSGRTVQGSLGTLKDGTLVLTRLGGRTVFLPPQAVARLDVRRRESRKLIGAVLGAIAGGTIASVAARPDSSCQRGVDLYCGLFDGINEAAQAGATVMGALGGGLLGALAAPGARWDRGVPVEGVRVSIRPAPSGGVGLGVTLSF